MQQNKNCLETGVVRSWNAYLDSSKLIETTHSCDEQDARRIPFVNRITSIRERQARTKLTMCCRHGVVQEKLINLG